MFLSDTNMVEQKRHMKDLNCCIDVAGKVTTPSLWCTILTLEITVERRQTYKLLLYYVCRPEWGTVPQDMALTEQKPDLVVIYEPAKPTRILLVELTVPWQFFKERQQGVKDWRKIWYRLALMHATFLSRSDVGEWGCCKPWIYLQPGVDLLHRWHWIRIFLQTQVL